MAGVAPGGGPLGRENIITSAGGSEHRCASNGVGHVIVLIARMIDGVIPATCDVAFQANELRSKLVIARQHNAPAVQQGQ